MAAHSRPNYMAIFYWLAILTAGEIAVTFLPIAKLLIGILLVGFALTKASLVALYFMHLRFEKPTLTLVALTPLVLCTLLVFLLLPDHGGTEHRTTREVATTHG
ncbi:MAG: hypothetical protein KatS3mg076_0339 [Candidatus Binatia bacterium]|nr:MAG: hypothetical protein KatS3mg076_0339 [Candidatus Binatia bacterium]